EMMGETKAMTSTPMKLTYSGIPGTVGGPRRATHDREAGAPTTRPSGRSGEPGVEADEGDAAVGERGEDPRQGLKGGRHALVEDHDGAGNGPVEHAVDDLVEAQSHPAARVHRPEHVVPVALLAEDPVHPGVVGPERRPDEGLRAVAGRGRDGC